MKPLQSAAEFPDFFGLYESKYTAQNGKFAAMAPGFSGAHLFRFSAPAGEMVLRVWPEHGIDPARWNDISRLLWRIHATGLNCVAPPVPTLSGEFCLFRNGRLLHLEPWLPGSPCAGVPEPDCLNSILQTLAAWHERAANAMPQQRESRLFCPLHSGVSDSLAARARKLNSLQGPGVAEELTARVFAAGDVELVPLFFRLQQVCFTRRDRLLQELQSGLQVLLPLQPVLRDVWREHVLLTENRVTGLIDVAAIACDSVLTDLTRLLGSLLGNRDDLWQAALAAYDQVRPLSPLERNWLLLFDESNLLLSAYGALDRLLALLDQNHSPFPPVTQRDRLVARIREYLTRLEQYDTFRRSMIDLRV